MSPPPDPPGPRWTAVALPAEHGSWSLVLEPVVLGIVLTPTAGSVAVGLAAVAAFLAYRPWKLWRGDAARGRSYPRTVLARRFAVTLGASAALALATSVFLGGWRLLVPALLALPLAGTFVAYDRRRGRSWQGEIAAPAAFSAVAAVETVAGGWSLAPALGTWAVMAARGIPSVVYVRQRLRLERGEPIRPSLTWTLHLVALAGLAALAARGPGPVWATAPFALLALRAAWGLSPFRRRVSPRAIGITEIAWGTLTVIGVAVAYWTSGPTGVP